MFINDLMYVCIYFEYVCILITFSFVLKAEAFKVGGMFRINIISLNPYHTPPMGFIDFSRNCRDVCNQPHLKPLDTLRVYAGTQVI